MKTNFLKSAMLAAMLSMGATLCAQQTINLPKPDMKAKSTNMIETLAKRHSVREYAATPLSDQELSNLCWAACGMSRDDNHRTAPTARNMQEIRLFVFTTKGAYEYDAKANRLVEKAKGDKRDLFVSSGPNAGFKQNFVMQAPVTLLMVIDFDIFKSNNQQAQMMGCVDAGIVCENINLYCQSVGLVTVPRATHDTAGLRKLLGLTDNQLPIMNNPVGKPKK